MSKDKHKKRDRALTFIRGLNRWKRSYGLSDLPKRASFSGPISKSMRECVDLGLAKVSRVSGFGRSGRARHNIFDAD